MELLVVSVAAASQSHGVGWEWRPPWLAVVDGNTRGRVVGATGGRPILRDCCCGV